MIKFNESFANIAKREAKKSIERYKVGAAISYKNKLISFGHNSLKTHPLSKTSYKTIHAEFAALLKADSCKIDTIYICRAKIAKEFGIAMPCKICMKMIKEAGIRTIWYTDSDSSWKMLSI